MYSICVSDKMLQRAPSLWGKWSKLVTIWSKTTNPIASVPEMCVFWLTGMVYKLIYCTINRKGSERERKVMERGHRTHTIPLSVSRRSSLSKIKGVVNWKTVLLILFCYWWAQESCAHTKETSPPERELRCCGSLSIVLFLSAPLLPSAGENARKTQSLFHHSPHPLTQGGENRQIEIGVTQKFIDRESHRNHWYSDNFVFIRTKLTIMCRCRGWDNKGANLKEERFIMNW